MKLYNLMFGKGRGGLEQAARDYHEALALAGHDVTTLLHPKAATKALFLDTEIHTLMPRGEWNLLAARKIRALTNEADAVLGHGNRAIGLALKACKGRVPVIGVAHNYNIKRFPRCDAAFCITRDLLEEMVHLNMPRDHLFHIPNMVRLSKPKIRTQLHEPVVIGSLGRFVEKKGFDIFLQCLQALEQFDVPFRAILGGDGPLAPLLQKQAKTMGIADKLEFRGWIEDQTAFYNELDLFVLPSRHEPFGIVLIEAMAAGLPCITTDTEGPCEIIDQHVDAIMIEKDRPYEMAQTIRELVNAPDYALGMGLAAYAKVAGRYDIEVVSKQLDFALRHAIARSG